METKAPQAEGHAGRLQFSRSARILVWVVLPAFSIGVGVASPLTAVLSLFILAPTFHLVRCDRRRPQRVDPETFVWTYVLTGTVGTAAVLIVQSLLAYLLALIFFQGATAQLLQEIQRGENEVASLDAEALAARSQMSRQWQYWAFMLTFAFCAASIPEELLKYAGLMYARRRGRVAHEHSYVTLGAAAALGFSTVENIGFAYAAAAQNQGYGELLLTAFERVVVGTPMHVMGGVLIGIAAARRDFRGEDVSLAEILRVPVLVHGVWDFSLFAVSALDGNVGWVHPRGTSLLIVLCIAIAAQGTLFLVVRKRYASWKTQEVSDSTSLKTT
ncbi:protease prsW family-domain-containing protein [Hypoxylon rubiginosum]|uniref:Protease prsW family-domain-containing protein n=1 Tax=Hypoxylon rubiginosum TaxID=110542 RepID=A0ACC0D0U0_9PEZI|nr:protease prsW family-domain-containing protein [Hypoxylon rubiginosum]